MDKLNGETNETDEKTKININTFLEKEREYTMSNTNELSSYIELKDSIINDIHNLDDENIIIQDKTLVSKENEDFNLASVVPLPNSKNRNVDIELLANHKLCKITRQIIIIDGKEIIIEETMNDAGESTRKNNEKNHERWQ